MQVLLVIKRTNLELHGAVVRERLGQGRVAKDVLEQLETSHGEHYQCLETLRHALKKLSIGFEETSRQTFDGPVSGYDAVITVGGDGTLLAASHYIGDQTPVLGVRSSSASVGYLCCMDTNSIEAALEALRNSQLRVQPVLRLVAHIDSLTDATVMTPPVLNDLLFSNSNPAATTRYRLTIDQRSEVHRSSGIWIATPTGSTAAIGAAGGIAQPLNGDLCQLQVRELYRVDDQDKQLERCFFKPDAIESDFIVLENRCETAILACDGQHCSFRLSYGDTITFKAGPPLQLGRPVARSTLPK